MLLLRWSLLGLIESGQKITSMLILVLAAVIEKQLNTTTKFGAHTIC